MPPETPLRFQFPGRHRRARPGGLSFVGGGSPGLGAPRRPGDDKGKPNRNITKPAGRPGVHDAAGAASRAGKRRLAFLHEGAAALDVVLAVEALLDQIATALEVALALVHRGLVGDE